MFSIKTVSNLEKILPENSVNLIETCGTMLSNEEFGFQVVLYSDDIPIFPLKLSVKSDVDVKIYTEKYIPAVHTANANCDDYFLTKKGGLFPDALIPYYEEEFILPSKINRTFFVTVSGREKVIKPSNYIIEIIVENEKRPEFNKKIDYNLNVLQGKLGENDLYFTRWIHFDCIAEVTKTEPFSEEFYSVLENYIKFAVSKGQTMVYLPLFTPPLDTSVGRERKTVQSIDVYYDNQNYSFSFDKLDRLIKICEKYNVKYFELSHLFTQWGAENCPKIMATDSSGTYKKIFGWQTSSKSEEYLFFLKSFLPQLNAFFVQRGIEKNTFLHLSDEPEQSVLEHYNNLHDILSKFAPDLKTMDALSSYEFAKHGVPDIPVVCIGAEEPFIKNSTNFWVYYACENAKNNCTNIFFDMPLLRTRILGIQLYLTGIKGFLQWGFNFYKTVLSLYNIDPFISGDGDGFFPAGDAFSVYPFGNGVISSIRQDLLFYGIEDYMALKSLENKIGRENTVEFANKFGFYADFSHYDKNENNFIAFRNELNKLIAKYSND